MDYLSPHREVQGSQDFIRRRCQCLTGIITSAAAEAAAADDDDAALSYDQRSIRAGPPVGPARPGPARSVREYSDDIKLCIKDFYG